MTSAEPSQQKGDLAAQIVFRCTVEGRPIVKKNTQRTVGYGRLKRVVYSAAFISWQDIAILRMRQAHGWRDAIADPITLRIRFYLTNRSSEPDLSNLIEGPQDALTKAGVIADDRLIETIHATKHFGEDPRVEIELLVCR